MTEPGPTEWSTGAPGVRPWAEEHRGAPPDDPRYDPELLEHGDTRNVVYAYRYWRREAIIADIDTRRHPLHVAIENFGNDANIGAVVRTANAFAVDTVHIVGRRRWNRRGAMVTDRYQRLTHHDSTEDLLGWAAAAGLTAVAVDNIPGAARLEETENELLKYLPDYEKWQSVIRVVDIAATGKEMWLEADLKSQATYCFLR